MLKKIGPRVFMRITASIIGSVGRYSRVECCRAESFYVRKEVSELDPMIANDSISTAISFRFGTYGFESLLVNEMFSMTNSKDVICEVT